MKLHLKGRSKFVGIHYLVLLAFVGPPPITGLIPLHNNGVRDDNRLENLRWGTHQDNADDRDRHGHTANLERNGNAKITQQIAVTILEQRNLFGASYGSIGLAIGLSKRQVMRICQGLHWKGCHDSSESDAQRAASSEE